MKRNYELSIRVATGQIFVHEDTHTGSSVQLLQEIQAKTKQWLKDGYTVHPPDNTLVGFRVHRVEYVHLTLVERAEQ